MWEPLISRPESGCCPGTLLKEEVGSRALGTLCLLAEIKTYIFNLRTNIERRAIDFIPNLPSRSMGAVMH